MEVIVLGSGAAEAIPNPFCRCDVCEHARRQGGREVRGRAAALINDDLLIDLGPDIVSAANRFNLYLGNLGTVLLTHRHEDHWLPSNVQWREPSFAPTPVAPLTIYGPSDALEDLAPHVERGTDLYVRPVTGGDRWTTGRYQVTALPATHGHGRIEALLYVVTDGTRRVLYATDTSSLGEAAWELLRPLGPLDLILLDATSGLRSGGSGHHGFEEFIDTRARLLQEGLLGAGTSLVAHHFSHNGGLTHADLVAKFEPYGVTVSYDGRRFSL
jgi:phosphoribosyl 1,2-cyclic phosphate phosphodiesterase